MPVAMKRPAASGVVALKVAKSAAPAPKKARVQPDPLQKPYAAAVAGLKEADVPPDVVTMLDAMLPFALKQCRPARDHHQSAAVEMAAQLLDGVEERLRGDVAAAEGAAADLEKQEGTRQEAVARAQAARDAKAEVASAKRKALGADALVFKDRKAAAKEADEARVTQASTLEGLATKRAELVDVQSEQLRPLIEGVEEAAAKGLASALMAALGKLELDQSILVALPGALSKAPSARGPFDTMVLAQLDGELSKRIAELQASLDDGDAARARATSAAEAAQRSYEEARERQLRSAQAFKAADAEQGEAEALLQQAQRELRGLGPAQRGAAQKLAREEKRLQRFREGPLAAFGALRDREPELEKPEETEDVPKVEEAIVDPEDAVVVEAAVPDAVAA